MSQGTRTIAVAAVCLTAGVAAAKPSTRSEPERRVSPPIDVDDGNECPYALRGVKLEAGLDKRGVIFEFTNPRVEYVKDVREQLREAAELIQELSRKPVDQATVDPDAPRLPPLAISVKDIAFGARVVIHAVNVEDRAELRELAAGFAEFWEHSDCSMGDSVSV